MSSYQPLADHLASRKGDRWDATFEEIERTLGRPLPKSAYLYNAWWANQVGPGHSQTHGWRSVGWRTSKLDLERRRVRFEREEPPRLAHFGRGEDLVSEAMKVTGITDRDVLIEKALQTLIAREAARHLIAMGGRSPGFEAPPRRRPAT